MHKFLRAIGFSYIDKNEFNKIIQDIMEHPQNVKVTKDSEGNEFAELSQEFAGNIGITVRGTYEQDDSFHYEYYYPYFTGTNVTTQEQIEVEKHAEKESYAGVCDDVHLGVTLIFYLQNVVEYLSEHNRKISKEYVNGAVLSGLCTEGKILLPIAKKGIKQNNYKRSERAKLVAEAREGNEEAIESLTMEDMDIYSMLSRRIVKEDILSIVNTCFMPYGIESDQYSILGEILDYAKVTNSCTGEILYCIKLICNDIIFDICINQKDLMGEPEIGRRFKGNVWMQGSVCLN